MEELTITDALLAPLRDQVVLVTGGASGIGLATVSLLLSLGAKVISVDWKEEEEAGQVVSEKEDYQYVKADVTSWVDLRAAFNLAIKKHGHIDHVFANAGINKQGIFRDDDLDASGGLKEPDLSTINVGLIGAIYTVKLGIYHIKQNPRGGGSIVVTASASSFQRFPIPDYTIAKHGVLGLVRTLSAYLHKPNTDPSQVAFRVNAIAPSWTETSITPREAVEAAGIRIQSPEIAARSALYLMADTTRHGQLLYSREARVMEIEEPMLAHVRSMMQSLPRQEKSQDTETEELWRILEVRMKKEDSYLGTP